MDNRAGNNRPLLFVFISIMTNSVKFTFSRYLPAVVLFCSSAWAADAASRVEVAFDHPEKFKDVRESSMQSDKDRDHLLGQIQSYVEEQAQRLVAPDQKLTITFTEIDMAGDFEPWRGPQWSDIRVVKDIYPPRIDLSYKLTDASGAVLREGTAQLRDLMFTSRMTMDRNDPLRIEKDLLRDWLRSEFKAPRK